MNVIIYGHPRSRSNLVCSYIEGFPTEVFHLSRVNANAEIEWDKNFDPRQNVQSGIAEKYLSKIQKNPPSVFKLFGCHLEMWPECFDYIKGLDYKVLRIYRRDKLDAILSFLVARKRGWTSFSQNEIFPFRVDEMDFSIAFKMIVTDDLKWEKKFNFHAEIEYNDVQKAIESGDLREFGVGRQQMRPLRNQNSIEAARILILNKKEVEEWYDKACSGKFLIGP